jgi:hypothetical protein
VIWPRTLTNWGSTALERAQRFGCDELIENPDEVLFRAVEVRAPVELTFRWLCQLRAAPYSYDRIDNRGRRSPQTLTPGLDELVVGQSVQTIFTLAAFEPGRSLTIHARGTLFGEVSATYRADPIAGDRSRIVVKLLVGYPNPPIQRSLMRLLLPPGDLVMMRRQLLNLKALAERTARASSSA